MRDIAVLVIVALGVGLAFYRPWIGLLALTVHGFMHPQGYGSEFLQQLPVYKLQFAAVCAGMLLKRQWRLPPRDWRLIGLAVLWIYFLFTTYQAKVEWAAWPRLFEISKIYLALSLMVLLIDTRQKLFLLIVTLSVSIALVTVKGGYWALMTGFADRVYGPPQSQYYDNNMFAIAVVMNLPLLVLWLRETGNSTLRNLLWAAIVLSAAAALSSWSRGALLALSATTAVLLWTSKRRSLAGLLVIAGVVLAAVALPDAWFERMHTIAAHGGDQSAQSRLDAWRVGVRHALAFPVTGVGFDGWHYAMVTMDWHNSYIEMMAEHGFIAFGLWCALLFGTMLSLWRMSRSAVQAASPWVANHAQMTAAALVAFAMGSLFLGLSYWDLVYQLIVIAALLSAIARGDAAGEAAAARQPRGAPGTSSTLA